MIFVYFTINPLFCKCRLKATKKTLSTFFATLLLMLAFTKKEKALFKRLNTPAKIQDFINTLPINHESDGIDTVKSPLMVLRTNSAHCIEGAILGAYLLSLHGHKPLVLHLQAKKTDFDHIVSPFKQDGYWGALSKTNHTVLRYREPVYKSIRELVMSYFHEYFTDDGVKTLRKYSAPLDLSVFGSEWMNEEDYLWGIDQELGAIKHFDIAPASILKRMRRADMIERKAGILIEWKSPKKS